MSIKIYVNGKYCDKQEAKISVFDHGLLYGDGVFEGMRSYSRLIFRLKEHIDRLYESARAIKLQIPVGKRVLAGIVLKTVALNDLENAYIRLVVTRGVGDLGLDPRKCSGRPSIIVIADKIMLYPEKYYKHGLAIIIARTQQNSIRALNPAIKSLNYLNNIMAKIEAANSGREEAIMLDAKGYVTECTGDNIFIIKNSVVYTPPLSVGILKGVTRDAVIEIARKRKIMLKERNFKCEKVYSADECFLTGTAAELIPVVKVDSKKIAFGRPGPMTLLFSQEFHRMARVDGVRY
ncbi:MAG: branched-chain-amino-acid transaminase [Candidatus Omnitrophota bacterium]|jgi:branched-chain amino acid aminotransferase